MNLRKIAILILAAAAVYLTAVLGNNIYQTYARKRQEKKEGDADATGGGTSEKPATGGSTTPSQPAAPAPAFPLRYGTGTRQRPSEAVKQLQKVCLDHGISVGASGIDGIWGKNTEDAVGKLQQLQVTARASAFVPILLPATLIALGLTYNSGSNTASGTPYAPYIKPVTSPTHTASHLEVRTQTDLDSILNIHRKLRSA